MLTHPKKRTVGIRVPDYPICLELIRELGRPVIAITAKLPGVEDAQPDSGNREIFLSRFDNIVDVIVDNQEPLEADGTTVVDLTGEEPVLIREGVGIDRLKDAIALHGSVLQED